MRLLRLPWLRLALLPLLAASAAVAQSVRWEPADSGLPNALALVFDNCAPEGQPELPAVPGVTFTFLGRAESMNMVNFQTSRSVTLSYLLRGRQNGPVQIPAFTVKTDKGPQRVAAFNAAAPAAPLESVAGARLIPERTNVWAGEVFALTYELSASRRANPQISPTFDWNAAPLVAEDWSKPEVTDAVTGGERRVNVTFRTRAVAKAPNTLKLEAASHLLSIQTGTIGFGIISQPRMEQVSVTSDQPTLEIRPLPAAPPGFSGAVGQFKLAAKVVPEKAAVGEPVTWTLELSGTGNWPEISGLPTRDVSNDFQVVQPKAKRTPVEGKLFDVTLAEDVVLVPTKPGSYALGPVSFTYFDPKAGSYRTITAPRTTVSITAPATPQFNVTPPSATAPESAPATSAAPATPPIAAPAPAAIPRDPLRGTAEAGTPWEHSTLGLLLGLPVAGVVLLWLTLALQRARRTDPVQPRREARLRLARLLSSPLPTETAALRRSLRQWQHEAAILWGVTHAAPSATALGLLGGTSSSPAAAWARLWAEADRALYGATPSLPADWSDRARQALAALRVPGFQPLRLFMPRNLFPFAALLAFSLLSLPDVAAAEDPLAAYRRGDFSAAEKAWREAVNRQPTDWIARHNLALALTQQGRTPEAAAQAAAAFVQEPGDSAVRWQFLRLAEKAGSVPAPLLGFVSPGTLHTISAHHSPSQWQVLLLASVSLAAAGAAVLLWRAYVRRTRLALLAGSLGITLGLGGTLVASGALLTWGLAGDHRAVIVTQAGVLRSIPTEADTSQKTSPLAAGSLALSGRTFLGWVQLTFENGQTGWVRKQDIVGLWQ